MSRKRLAGRFLRTTMLSGVAAIAALPAVAQDEGDSDDTIIVTGTRIQRPDLQAPTAVTTIDQSLIDASGAANIANILRDVPSFGVSGITQTNSNFSIATGGVNTLELRNLGEDRTLVLINGRRWVAGVPGTGAVDFNQLPVDLIERIDVITGGASSIYGSDALAGVINVILKDDFEGLQVTGQHGRTGYGDNRDYLIRSTLGGNFGDGRGNAVVSFEWNQNSGIPSANRPNTEIDDIAACLFDGNPLRCQTPVEPFTSSFPPAGRFIIEDVGAGTTTSFNINGDPFAFGTLTDGFNRQAFRTISIPIERYSVSSIASYDITDNISFFFEGSYASSKVETVLEPFPLSSDDIFNEGSSTGVDINNPFVPTVLRDLAIAAGDDNIGFTRRQLEVGPRGNTALRQTFRVVAGLRGDLGDYWNWDLYWDYGRTSDDQRSQAGINLSNYRFALDAEIGPDGSARCVDAIARAAGCVPINIFGEGSISPGAAAYVRHVQLVNSEIEQQVVGGSFTGPVPGVTLPGGEAQFAVGFEYREESSDQQPDGLLQTGGAGTNTFPAEVGAFDVIEGFVELELPIVVDQPFFEELTIGGAYRFSDYSLQGNTNAYSGRISWSPYDQLRFRAQYSRAVRAPNITELFAAGTENFATVSDPCNNVTATSTGTFDAGCRMDPLIAARIAATGSFTLSQAEIQGTGGFSGTGNQLLDPEKADTILAGMVYSGDLGNAGNFSFTADYFNIDIQGAVAQPGRTFSVEQCYANFGPTNVFCGFVVRDSQGLVAQQGEIDQVNTGVVNAGFIKTAGIDFATLYSVDLGNFGFMSNAASEISVGNPGSLTVRANYTWTRKFETEIFSVFEDDLGELGMPNHKILAGIVYENGPIALSFDSLWISNIVIDDESGAFVDADGDGILDPIFGFSVGDYWKHDVQLRVFVNESAELYFGIDNYTNAEPPNILTGIPGNSTGTDTAPDVYDVIGRNFYGGFRLKF